MGVDVLEDVTVQIGESAAHRIRQNADALTPEKQADLVRWLKGLTSRKLLSAGVELEVPGSGKIYEFQGAEFTLRFVISGGAPLVTQLLFN